MRRGHHRGPGAGGRVIEGLHSPTLIQGQAGSGQSPLPAGQMRGTARSPAGPPHTPFLMSLGGVGVGGGTCVCRGLHQQRARLETFIYLFSHNA